MSKHDVVAKDDVAAARAQQRGIEPSPQSKPERARNTLRQRDDKLVLDQRIPAVLADDERRVLGAGRLVGIRELILRARDLAHSHPCSRYHVRVLRMPSRSPFCGAYPISARARLMSNARLLV